MKILILSHNTSIHIQCLYQISKSQVQQFLRNLSDQFPYVLHWSERWKKKQEDHDDPILLA